MKLKEAVKKAYILAYKEDTSLLENTLSQMGFDVVINRQIDTDELTQTAAIYRVFRNHREVWLKAANEKQPVLVFESDFVPVRGMGELPVPYPVEEVVEGQGIGFSYLYGCAQQIYSVSKEGKAEGFSTAAVAYVLFPAVAQELLSFVYNAPPKDYYSWDSEIEGFLRKRGYTSYVPFKNYGEHGGDFNQDHLARGFTTHRADVLFDVLSFNPLYANKGKVNSLTIRFKARLKGISRLFLGRFLRVPVVKYSSTPLRMIRFAVLRQFPWTKGI